jgi:hypothetical protein
MTRDYKKVSKLRFARTSAYQKACPFCEAPAGYSCISMKSGKPVTWPHPSRRPEPRQIESDLFRPALPDLSGWYREMARYEGQFAKPRPAELEV